MRSGEANQRFFYTAAPGFVEYFFETKCNSGMISIGRARIYQTIIPVYRGWKPILHAT